MDPTRLSRVSLTLCLGAWLAFGAGDAEATQPETTGAAPLMTLDDVGSGRLLLRSDRPGAYVPAPLVSTDIDVSVTGTVARAVVTQRFRNPSDQWVDGIYAFPLPEESAVDRLRMRIGDRFIEGQIRERQEAKAIFEEAKAEGKKAALVEQERPNLFTNTVANIGPGEVIVTQIAFQQALAPKDGTWELRLPLVVAPRYVPGPVVQAVTFGAEGWAVADPVPDRARIQPPVADPRTEPKGALRNPVDIEIDLAPGFAIAPPESAFHEITVQEIGDGQSRVTLTGAVPADRDFALRWRAAGSAPEAALFAETLAGAEHMMLMLSAPDLGQTAPVPPREVIFVQDVSGSMSGGSIEQARAGLEMAIRRLRPEDRFNLIVFNNEHAQLSAVPLQATDEAKARAVGAVRALVAEGGTEMAPALGAALAGRAPDGRLRQIVFLTDGAVGNEAGLLALIAQKLGDSRLFMVGIGSAPNGYFMARAAEAGRGAHVLIGDLSEVQARMEALFAKLERPAITDLALTLPEGAVAEVHPTPLPDLYAGEPLTVALKGTGLGGEALIAGTRAGRPWQVTVPLGEAAPREGVAKLFARRRIARLEALRSSWGVRAGTPEADEVQETGLSLDEQILATALDYGLVSRLTSLVAVDATPSRPADARLASADVALNLPKGWDPKAFLFEDSRPAPPPDRASLERLAPATPRDATPRTQPMVPRGALNWRQSLTLGLLLMLTGLVTLLATRVTSAPGRRLQRSRP